MNDFRTKVLELLRCQRGDMFGLNAYPDVDIGDAELLHIIAALIDDRASVDRMLAAIYDEPGEVT
jgi:hypothetical protein